MKTRNILRISYIILILVLLPFRVHAQNFRIPENIKLLVEQDISSIQTFHSVSRDGNPPSNEHLYSTTRITRSKNIMVSSSVYDEKGDITQEYKCEFDAEMNLLTEYNKPAWGTTTITYTYGKNGKLEQKITRYVLVDKNTGPWDTTRYHYDTAGNLVCEYFYDSYGNIIIDSFLYQAGLLRHMKRNLHSGTASITTRDEKEKSYQYKDGKLWTVYTSCYSGHVMQDTFFYYTTGIRKKQVHYHHFRPGEFSMRMDISFDTAGRLILYDRGPSSEFMNSHRYTYTPKGLPEQEIVVDENREKHFYRYLYTSR